MYMWSALGRAPPVRAILQGKDASITPKGVSQTYTRTVGGEYHPLRHATDHCKFWEDVFHFSIVRSTVHKHDDPRSAVNQLAQSGPLRLLQGVDGRNISQWRNPRVDERRTPDVLGGYALWVCEYEGQDLVGVQIEPSRDIPQVFWFEKVSRRRSHRETVNTFHCSAIVQELCDRFGLGAPGRQGLRWLRTQAIS